MTLGGSNCAVRSGTRGKSTEVQFRGRWDHINLISVVSNYGQVMTPLIVLPGVRTKWRKRANRKIETLPEFLPQPNMIFHRPIAGVDSKIFEDWAPKFVEVKTFLRIRDKKCYWPWMDMPVTLRLMFYHYWKMKESSSSIWRPIHHMYCNHWTLVFSALWKRSLGNYFWREPSRRKDDCNDSFALCEILTRAPRMCYGK